MLLVTGFLISYGAVVVGVWTTWLKLYRSSHTTIWQWVLWLLVAASAKFVIIAAFIWMGLK